MGFFTDAYDLFCISLITKLLGRPHLLDCYHVDAVPARHQPPQGGGGITSSYFGVFSRGFLHCHGMHLLGTASTWFLLEIAFYTQNLFPKDIFRAVGSIPNAATTSALGEVYRIAPLQTLVALCGIVPGYSFTVALIDVLGHFAIQVLGFFTMIAFMLGLANDLHDSSCRRKSSQRG
ncbi:inorganic phosphate transporter 1-6-like [Zingiber officinale]|uniref:inorganic phosphate transporter 1-6-like n=1 Tax=Zingiber officinale TaxID=94328 RepID=UPI001C4AF30F|nr:inorganic phosphate transporter 1-6-like [Zingiber officinale]